MPIQSIDDLQPYREQILNLAHHYGASNVRVFGSVVRQDTHANSDVDLLVDFEQHSLVDRIQLIQALSDLLACKVDVVQEKSLRSHVKQQALAEATKL
ncbi:MAG: nucleotidyltransferase family protein [Phototrophicaceae bacterium]